MPAKSLGNKFTCFSCQAKFYDLARPDAICPKCGSNQKDAPKTKPQATRSRAVERVREEPYRPPEDEVEEGAGDAPVVDPEAEDGDTPTPAVAADDDE